MAKSDNERGAPVVFKHRIVGAVVLVALAVLILPMILNAPAPVAQERPSPTAEAGKEGTKLFVSRITPAGESTKLEQVNKSIGGTLPPLVSPPAPPVPDSVPTIPATTEAKPVDKSWAKVPTTSGGSAPNTESAGRGAKSKEAAAEKPKEAVTTKPKDVAGEQKPVKEKSGWIVQAGVFAQRANADRVAARLKSGGYQPSVGPTTQKGVALYRVYVGPYASRDEAARASVRVGQTLHEKVAVVAYP